MFCIKCGKTNTLVSNSRKNVASSRVWRRRTCTSCGHVFTTYETVALDQLKVKHDNNFEDFSHSRLLISIASCFEHTPQKRPEHAEALSWTIEAKLLRNGSPTSPEAICAATFDALKRFDRLASVQYAARHARFLKKQIR